METSAPTIRALELENQKLRADVAELVEGMRAARRLIANWVPSGGIEAEDEIDALILKHGA